MGNCNDRLDLPSPVTMPRVADSTLNIPISIPPTAKRASTTTLAREISRRIEEELEQERLAAEKRIKLLLLGPAESGKTTLLKQLKIIHLKGYSQLELFSQRTIIYQNVVECMIQLLKGVRKLGLKLPNEFEGLATNILALQSLTVASFEQPLYLTIKALWRLPVIQEAYARRSEFQLLDCAKHFLDDLDRLYAIDYRPTIKDVLHARIVTYGVHELRYAYGDREFRIVDVGGQRSERRKWISVFDNVHAVIFIAAVSEFDQMMLEDNETNRLLDSIRLFKDIVNNPVFLRSQMVLFLNKMDLFAEKIKRVKLKKCFPNYKFKNDYENASAYIAKKFEKQVREAQNENERQKNLYTHLTCAQDTSQMQFLTNTISDMIVAAALKRSGTC